MNENKKMYLHITCGVLIVIAGYMLCSRIHSNESGIGQVRDSVRQATEQLNQAGAGVSKAKDTAADLEHSVDTSRELNTSNAELIAEGKRILATIRARGQKN